MIRIFKHYIPVQLIVLALLEGAVFFASVYAGVTLRDYVGEFFDIGPIYPIALSFALVMLSIMSAFGLYTRDIPQGEWGFYGRYMMSFFAGLLIMVLVFYLIPSLFLGRGAFGLGFLVAILGSSLTRYIFFRLVNHAILKRRILVLGTGSRSANIKMLIDSHEPTFDKFHIVGFLPFGDEQHYVDKDMILHDKGTLLSIATKYEIDEIIVGIRDRRNCNLSMNDLLECKLEGVNVTDVSSFFERERGHVQLDSLNPSWMVYSDGFCRTSFRNTVKRLFDVMVSCILLVLTLPVMVLTSIAIYLETGLPILYRQRRVGECGNQFNVLKFRSMRVNAENEGSPQWARENDERITRVGKIIRNLRIDELPQIFNVLKGDMSFVGPRPERPYFVDQLAREIPYFSNRHVVKPGITGWAQVRYPYGASVEDSVEKLQYDLYYAKNHSLFLDIIILFQTAQVVLFGKGAR